MSSSSTGNSATAAELFSVYQSFSQPNKQSASSANVQLGFHFLIPSQRFVEPLMLFATLLNNHHTIVNYVSDYLNVLAILFKRSPALNNNHSIIQSTNQNIFKTSLLISVDECVLACSNFKAFQDQHFYVNYCMVTMSVRNLLHYLFDCVSSLLLRT
jgi:hypothetical protein